MMRILAEDRAVSIAKIMPYLCLLVVAIFFVINIATGRSDTALKGLLAYGTPVISASVIAIWRVRSSKKGQSAPLQHYSFLFIPRSFSYLALGFTTLYLISLSLIIASENRPLAYFCLIAVLAGLIFLEILGIEKTGGKRVVIVLTQIALLFLNVIWGVTLRVPFYYGGYDIPSHLVWINSLIQNGHITTEMSYYQYFPIFHIFNAIGVIVTGMGLKISYFVFCGLLAVFQIPIIYGLACEFVKDKRIALSATLLFISYQSAITYGMYVVTRCMAVVLCLFVFYLITQQRHLMQFRIYAILTMFTLILVHQTTLVQFAIIWAVIMIIEYITYRHSRIGLNLLILFSVLFLSYWLYVAFPFFQGIITIATGYGESGRPVIQLPQIGLPSHVPIMISLIRQLDYTIILFFALLGILTQLHEARHKPDIVYALALFSLASIPFFIPEFYYLFSGLLLLYRTPLLFFALIVLFMAKGLFLFVKGVITENRYFKQAVVIGCSLFIVTLFSLFSLIIVSTTIDLDIPNVFIRANRDYFTQTELESLDFIVEHQGSIPIYADGPSNAYISVIPHTICVIPSTVYFDLDVHPDKKALFVFRKQEYYTKGMLEFHMGTYKLGQVPDIEGIWAGQSKVYDSQSVVIYLVYLGS